MADGKLVYDIVANTDNLDADLSKAEKTASSKLEKMGSVGKAAGAAIATSFAAIGAAAISVGGIAINSANNFDIAMNQIAAATGAAEDELKEYETTLKNIYTNNYGESFEDIADKVSRVEQQIKNLNQADLQNIVEGLYTLEDTFESDFNETLRGLDQLITQFGLSSAEALDLMASGMQHGLNYTDELGDNIAEYAGKFAQAGYTAEEYFQLLANGSQGGAYNLDKINDAINEITTRLADGTIDEKLGSFSEGTQKVFKAWKDGSASQKQVIDSIVKDINDCESAQQALTLAATAFGTMGEDANLDFVKSLTAVGEEFDNVAGTMEKVKAVKYDDLGSMLAGVSRALETLLIPLGESLIPILQDILTNLLPVLQEALPPIITALEEMFPPILAIVSEALPPLIELFNQLVPLFFQLLELLSPIITDILPILSETLLLIVPILQNILSAILPPLLNLLVSLLDPLMQIIEMLLPPLLQIIEALLPPLINILNAVLPPLLDVLLLLLDPIIDLIETLLPPLVDMLDGLGPMFEAVGEVIVFLAEMLSDELGEAFERIMPMIELLMEVLGNLIEFITNVFSGDWESAWDSLVSVFKSAFGIIPQYMENIINTVIDAINNLLDGLSWAADLIGIDISFRLGHISLPKFHTGGIVDFNTNEGAALLQDGEMILTQHQQAELFAIANGEELSSNRQLTADITLTGDVQMDGFKVGKVVLRNLDDVASFMLRG